MYVWSKCRSWGRVTEMDFLVARVLLFSGSSIRAGLHKQTQAPAYNSVELLTACLKKAEKEHITGCTHTPFCCLCAILHMLFLWINDLHQWSVREFSSNQGIDKRESPKRPPLGCRSAFFLLAFTFLQATAQKAPQCPDWCQLRWLLQQNPEQQVKNHLPEPEESRKVYHPPSLGKKKNNLPALWSQRLTSRVSFGTSEAETLPIHFLYLPFGLGSLFPLKGGTCADSALSFQGFHPASPFLGKISVPSEVSVPLLVPRCTPWEYTVRSQHTTSKGKSHTSTSCLLFQMSWRGLLRVRAGAENWPRRSSLDPIFPMPFKFRLILKKLRKGHP